jgi:hypothetical protein
MKRFLSLCLLMIGMIVATASPPGGQLYANTIVQVRPVIDLQTAENCVPVVVASYAFAECPFYLIRLYDANSPPTEMHPLLVQMAVDQDIDINSTAETNKELSLTLPLLKKTDQVCARARSFVMKKKALPHNFSTTQFTRLL